MLITPVTSLDTRRQAQERQTKECLETNGGGRDEDTKPCLGYHPDAGPGQEWGSFVTALHASGQ